jgi:hypothetical protein
MLITQETFPVELVIPGKLDLVPHLVTTDRNLLFARRAYSALRGGDGVVKFRNHRFWPRLACRLR